MRGRATIKATLTWRTASWRRGKKKAGSVDEAVWVERRDLISLSTCAVFLTFWFSISSCLYSSFDTLLVLVQKDAAFEIIMYLITTNVSYLTPNTIFLGRNFHISHWQSRPTRNISISKVNKHQLKRSKTSRRTVYLLFIIFFSDRSSPCAIIRKVGKDAARLKRQNIIKW